MKMEKYFFKDRVRIMTKEFFKYIKSLNKDENASEKLSVMLIVILLLSQIVITYYVCRSNNLSSYNNFVSQIISSRIASEESRKDNFSAIAAAIASNGKVLKVGEMQSPTYMDLVEPCSEIRKLEAISPYISNIYVYNGNYEYIYDAYGVCADIHDASIEKIKIGIDNYFSSNEMFFSYVNPASGQYNQKVYSYEIYRSASSRNGLIIFELDTNAVFAEYKRIPVVHVSLRSVFQPIFHSDDI